MRRISTKLVAAVLATVVLPFGAFALFLEGQIANRLTRQVVQQSLLSLAKDLARQVDGFLVERTHDLELLALEPVWADAARAYREERARLEEAGDGAPPRLVRPPWDAVELSNWAQRRDAPPPGGRAGVDLEGLLARPREQAAARLDALCQVKPVYDLVLLVGDDGRVITSSSRHPQGGHLALAELEALFAADLRDEVWLQRALQGQPVAVNHHSSPLRVAYRDVEDGATGYQLGFALPVARGGEVRAVLYALVNWGHVQELVAKPVVEDWFRGLAEEGEDPSPYAWIWDADADTILGHPNRELYYQSITEDVGLPQMTNAVLDSRTGNGLYPEYEFEGVGKNAAFQRTLSADQGGFGWVVGVGIDNRDIYRIPNELRRLLIGGSAFVLLMSVGWTFLIARRMTRPIQELQATTRRVAEGDLSARAAIQSGDELGALATDFNAMTEELSEQRARIVAAEKDAAWREMARQIAHDIKNPLTPIQLSLDLLRRARRENAERSEEILERTLELVDRQVGRLKRIAAEFYEFTGGRKPRPETLDLHQLVDEVLHLHDAWAVDLGVEIQREHAAGSVWADRDKLHRVLVNLSTNALQAMPRGGRLEVRTRADATRATVEIRDTGEGLAPDSLAHLFEPYFTTKSEGTGLGLAISKRALEEMEGTIELEPAAESDGDWTPGGGTVARITLPVSAPSPGAGEPEAAAQSETEGASGGDGAADGGSA